MKTIMIFAGILIICFLAMSCSKVKSDTNNEETIADKEDDWSMLVGTYTGQGSEGIYLIKVNKNTGALKSEGLLAKTDNPSYLAIDSLKKFVYCVNENDTGSISTFEWNHQENKLNLIGSQPSLGSYPCYIVTDKKENTLAVSNYMSGNVTTYSLQEGSINGSGHLFQHEGSGPVQDRQEGPHAHCVNYDSQERFLYAVDLGIDKIIAYPFHGSAELGSSFIALELQPGDGPRHLVFHPKRDLAFIVNELSSTVISLRHNPTTGMFEKMDRASTLPEGYSEPSYCADIHVSGNGKFLYVSNRGHNSIAVFEISDDGKLKKVGIEKTRGNWPRNFTLSPDGRFLIVANERSDDIFVFKVDPESGQLQKTDTRLEISKPVCLKF